jgi:VanZ family protein
MIQTLLRWTITASYLVLVTWFSTIPSTGIPLFPSADKVIHFLLYAVLGALCVWALSGLRRFLPRTIFCTAFLMATAYGGLMEVAQYFTPDRSMELLDAFANAAGAAMGAGFAMRRCCSLPERPS